MNSNIDFILQTPTRHNTYNCRTAHFGKSDTRVGVGVGNQNESPPSLPPGVHPADHADNPRFSTPDAHPRCHRLVNMGSERSINYRRLCTRVPHGDDVHRSSLGDGLGYSWGSGVVQPRPRGERSLTTAGRELLHTRTSAYAYFLSRGIAYVCNHMDGVIQRRVRS